VSIDDEGNIYVSSQSNKRISKWDRAGTYIGSVGGGFENWTTIVPIPGVHGYQLNYFDHPFHMFASGQWLYVADSENNRITRWNKDSGEVSASLGCGSSYWNPNPMGGCVGGYQRYEFSIVTSVVQDSTGKFYMADQANNRIVRWDVDQDTFHFLGCYQEGWQGDDFGYNFCYGSSEPYSFSYPTDIAIGTDGSLYIADSSNHRISKWSMDGSFQGWIGGGMVGWQTNYIQPIPYGWEMDEFNSPEGVAVDGDGNIYVADTYNNRVVVWDSTGTPVKWIGDDYTSWQTTISQYPYYTGTYCYNEPSGIDLDEDGFIYVTDTHGDRVIKLRN
jgi:tripartite motif-containing protein 71